MTKLQNYDLQLKAITTTGTAPDLEVSIPREDYTSLTDQKLLLKIHADCSGNVTINVNGLGAKDLMDANGNNIDSLSAGDYIEVIYNGSEFVNIVNIQNQLLGEPKKIIFRNVTGGSGGATVTHNLGYIPKKIYCDFHGWRGSDEGHSYGLYENGNNNCNYIYSTSSTNSGTDNTTIFYGPSFSGYIDNVTSTTFHIQFQGDSTGEGAVKFTLF